jgi:hypothetical protein
MIKYNIFDPDANLCKSYTDDFLTKEEVIKQFIDELKPDVNTTWKKLEKTGWKYSIEVVD